jgi:hypothetical protein
VRAPTDAENCKFSEAKQKAVTETSVTAELFKNVKENDLTKQGECGKIVV